MEILSYCIGAFTRWLCFTVRDGVPVYSAAKVGAAERNSPANHAPLPIRPSVTPRAVARVAPAALLAGL
jgi:hypothetical protein